MLSFPFELPEMCIPKIYLEMVGEYLIHQGLSDLPSKYLPSPPATPSGSLVFDTCLHYYLNDCGTYIADPTPYEMYTSYNTFGTKKSYTPYRRISHFREHLNRLMSSQWITISDECYAFVKSLFETTPSLHCDHNVYSIMHQALYRNGFSKFIEQIHYLIHQFTNISLYISTDQHASLCSLFTQMEHQFTHHSLMHLSRKNFVSYHILIQFLLLLHHIHPVYYLPSIKDLSKREHYYALCLLYFSATPNYSSTITNFIRQTLTCTACLRKEYMFDHELVSMMFPLKSSSSSK